MRGEKQGLESRVTCRYTLIKKKKYYSMTLNIFLTVKLCSVCEMLNLLIDPIHAYMYIPETFSLKNKFY